MRRIIAGKSPFSGDFPVDTDAVQIPCFLVKNVVVSVRVSLTLARAERPCGTKLRLKPKKGKPMKSTLTLFTAVFALLAGLFSPETAWAGKKRNQRPSCDQFSGIQCAGFPGVYRHTNYRSSGKYKPGNELVELFQLLNVACQGGGLALTVATFTGAAAAGPLGWGVGGACLVQQLVAMGMPPPKPIYVNGPDKKVVINIDLNDPKVREFFQKNPQLFEKLPKSTVEPGKGADVPMVSAPDASSQGKESTAQNSASPAPKVTGDPAPAVKPVPTVPPADMPEIDRSPHVPAEQTAPPPQQDVKVEQKVAPITPTKVEYGLHDARKRN